MKKNSSLWKNKPVKDIFIRSLRTDYDKDANVIRLDVIYHIKGLPGKEYRYQDVLPMGKGKTYMTFTTLDEWIQYAITTLMTLHNTEINFLIHPGEHLKEYMESRNMLQIDVARKTMFSEKHISRVINGLQGITAQFALGLERAFPDVKATFWMNLQTHYDLERLSRAVTNIEGQE